MLEDFVAANSRLGRASTRNLVLENAKRVLAKWKGAAAPAPERFAAMPPTKIFQRPVPAAPYRDANHARHVAEQATQRAHSTLAHYFLLAIGDKVNTGDCLSEIRGIADDIIEAAAATAAAEHLGTQEETDAAAPT